jgi:hypothetical protein
MPSKDEEHQAIEALFRANAELESGEWDCSGERPDCLMKAGNRVVGIEVTRFRTEARRQTNPHEQEALRTKVLRQAHENHRTSGAEPLHVQVIFSSLDVTKARVKNLAKELAAFLIPARIVSHTQPEPWLLLKESSRFLPEVASISASPVPSEDHAAWVEGNWGWPGEANLHEIQEIVRAKEQHLPTYRSRCDEVWLLITFRSRGAHPVQLPSELDGTEIRSAFDRVLCVDLMRSRCVEIPVAPIGEESI